jgi:predicted TIM-barrel fold metal-dependent hydrolase
LGAPKDRRGHATGCSVGLPEGTVVFSADNHITLAEDIFYQRFPDKLKEEAPRIWYDDGAYHIGVKGQSFLWDTFSAVVMQYDDLPGAVSTNIEARIEELRADGVDKELAFPNAILALFGYPDKEIRELAFRVYNEYVAELQERSGGHFYGVGLINWWDPQGARRTLAELKSLGLKTFLLPLNPGKDDEGNPIDYASTAMTAVFEEIEAAGLPLTHHIGETPPKIPSEFNPIVVSMMTNIDGFREVFSKYIFGGILDRHPGLQIGWFEGGIAWVPWALQDAEHLVASYRHMLNRPLEHDVRYYWDNHMSASFMLDPVGLQLIERIGVNKVFWSSDYPHNESTYGYSEKSLATVVEAVGPQAAARIINTNITEFLGL